MIQTLNLFGFPLFCEIHAWILGREEGRGKTTGDQEMEDKTFIHFMSKCFYASTPGSYPGTYQHPLYTQRQELDHMVVGTLDYRNTQRQAGDGRHQDAGL